MTPDDALARIPPQQLTLSLGERLRMIARAAVGSIDVKPGSLGYTILSRINMGGLGLPPRRGTPQLLQAYSEMPWLRAIASRVASAFASVEWRLYYGQRPGAARAYKAVRAQKASPRDRRAIRKAMRKEGELREIQEHPLLDALDSANAFHTGYQMRRLTCLYLDLVGDAFWAKERNAAGVPVAFWPIPPSWILSTPTPQRPAWRFSYRGWQGELPDVDVLWFQDTDPANPYGRGTGLGASLGDELEADEYAARTMKQVFFNRALPEALITAEGMSEPETRRLEYEWLAKNQGFFRGFKPMFMNRKVEIHEFDHDFRQLQFVQLREFERDTIMQVWGIPPEVMGVIENSNRSTIDAADYFFTSKTVEPRCEFLRAIMQERLVPEYDERLILDYESPVEEDKEFKQKAMASMPGAYRVNEHRELTGHPELDGGEGEVFLVPSLMTVKETLEEAEPPPALAPVGGGNPAGPGPNGNGGPPKPPAPEGEPQNRAVARATRAKRGDLRAVKGAYEDAAARIAARLEPDMRAAFLSAVERVRGEVDLIALERAVAGGNVAAVNAALEIDHFANQLQGARGVIRDAFAAGGSSASDLLADAGIALSFRTTSPSAVAWVQARGAALVTEITVETRQAIQAAIEDAFASERPPRDVARTLLDTIGLTERQTETVDRFRRNLEAAGVDDAAIERRVGKYAAAQLRKRAMNIARTEIAFASNGGQQEAWMQARDAGLLDEEATRRVWIVTHDDRLDLQECEPMDEQERALTEPFVTGTGERVMQPPVHPQCRCTTGLVVRAQSPAERTLRAIADGVTKLGEAMAGNGAGHGRA